jgi:ATP-dependent DNA helicase RecG
VIGTHALLSRTTRFRRLGFVIIDEQHRFGVAQRESLLDKADTPHALVMTATPIPRSLALLAFGDLDHSVLATRPGARGEVTTRVVPPDGRETALTCARERLRGGEQAYFVRPRIEGDAAGARELHAELSRSVPPDVRVGLVHGRLPASERDERLEAFRRGDLRALVATTVVEVGLDIPDATLLWVEGAERLGLAQLHQLRGRIARRGQKGYCWLVEGADAPAGSRGRLAALERIDDGMQLAELDLVTRGPGELLGLKQSGFVSLFGGLGPDASDRLASLTERARVAAVSLLATGERTRQGGSP